MSLRAAILGFLGLEPMSGYTLQQRFDGSVGGFWTATQSQIYRELHALEAAGLVTVKVEQGDGKPARKIYANTTAGQAELERWLKEPLPPLQLRHPLLLKLVFAAQLPPAVLDDVLARYEQGLAGTLDEYRERSGADRIFALARSRREGELWQLSLEHGIAWVDVELAWVKKARQRLAQPATGRPAAGAAGRATPSRTKAARAQPARAQPARARRPRAKSAPTDSALGKPPVAPKPARTTR
jgi:DNA-binding PadR family transcriptional regulator